MTESSPAQHTLQQRWDAACRILLGTSVGPLNEYKSWLLQLTENVMHAKSTKSGQDITYANPRYAKESKWISFDEIEFGKKFSPPNLESESIDQLLPSLPDCLYYAGNIVIGECGQIEKSSNIDRCFYTYMAVNMVESKYIACTTVGRNSEDCYGCNGMGNSSLVLKCYETFNDKRCLELWMSQNCSDCYYSYGLGNCSDCMFCFHLKGRKNCIGNCQLTPQKYKQVKEKLLKEMAAYLQKHKRLPSLAEIMKSVKMDKVLLAKVVVPPRLVPKTDITPIENGFAKTCELVLGKKLIGKMEDYAPWLMHHTRKIDAFKSALSGQDVFMGDYCACFELPKDRLIGADETKAFGECVALEEEQVTALDFPDKLAPLGKIAFCSPEYYEGTTENIIACPTAQDAAHCAYSFADVWAKYCAYGFWPRSSEHIFGFDTCLSSAFCINAYQSVGLKRCLEMDNCLNCSDCLFGHNLENCSDCMFCLNAKNLKFAIGNAPVGKEQYMKVKAVMLESMRKELEEKKSLKWDIFNIASAQGKK